jgi:hypothetical protein
MALWGLAYSRSIHSNIVKPRNLHDRTLASHRLFP